MNIYIARQPIFNRHQKVYGYELLYRSGLQNQYDNPDGDHATSHVVTNSLTVFGLDSLTYCKKAFINFTKNLIQTEIITALPPNQVVIEILEGFSLDAEFLEACKKLKRLGYKLALDDFVFRPEYKPLVQLADIVKIDFLNAPPGYRSSAIRQINQPHTQFLAEKVETLADYQQAQDLGYSYFQGYFFCKPDIVTAKDMPAYKLTYLRLLQHIHKPDVDFDALEQIIMQDVTLTYKLLRYINSAAFGFTSKIGSIKNALVMLGIKEIKKWVSLVAIKRMGEDKPEELVVDSLIRARFCELIAPLVGMANRSYDFFLMGMFSAIDSFLDRPLAEILIDMPIAAEIKDALMGKENTFFNGYDLCMAYKEGRWEKVDFYLSKYNLSNDLIPNHFMDSLKWVEQIYM